MAYVSETDKEIISNIKDVDEVIFPCPMSVTKEFIEKHQIDLVVHGFLIIMILINKKSF